MIQLLVRHTKTALFRLSELFQEFLPRYSAHKPPPVMYANVVSNNESAFYFAYGDFFQQFHISRFVLALRRVRALFRG